MQTYTDQGVLLVKETLYRVTRRILPDSVKRRIVNGAAMLDRASFAEVAHVRFKAPDMAHGLRRLAERGLQPRHVVDVGAFHGEWSLMAREIWPEAKITMLEANREKREILAPVAEQIGARLEFEVLGPEDGREVVFHVMEAGSSVLPENSSLQRREELRHVRQLDTFFQKDLPDFIKLDVQGYELEVLRGASQILEQAQAVLMEVSLIEINRGAPLMAEVVGFMADKGFEVCDILELHRRPLDRATNQVDLLFVLPNSPLLNDTRHF